MIVIFEYEKEYRGLLPGSRQKMIQGAAQSLVNRQIGRIISDTTEKGAAKKRKATKTKASDDADVESSKVDSAD